MHSFSEQGPATSLIYRIIPLSTAKEYLQYHGIFHILPLGKTPHPSSCLFFWNISGKMSSEVLNTLQAWRKHISIVPFPRSGKCSAAAHISVIALWGMLRPCQGWRVDEQINHCVWSLLRHWGVLLFSQIQSFMHGFFFLAHYAWKVVTEKFWRYLDSYLDRFTCRGDSRIQFYQAWTVEIIFFPSPYFG